MSSIDEKILISRKIEYMIHRIQMWIRSVQDKSGVIDEGVNSFV